MPKGPRPESLHDQLVYLGGRERLRLNDITELALRWLELINEMGGLPETDQPRRSGTDSQLRWKGKPRRYYYRCPTRAVNGLEACQMRTNYRAEKIEAQVWETISGILTHPEQLRADLEEVIDRERESSLRGDPELERKAWMDKLAEIDRMRS